MYRATPTDPVVNINQYMKTSLLHRRMKNMARNSGLWNFGGDSHIAVLPVNTSVAMFTITPTLPSFVSALRSRTNIRQRSGESYWTASFMVRESASGVVLKLWVSDPSKLISFPRQWAVVTLPGMCTLTLKFIRTVNSIVFYVEAVK